MEHWQQCFINFHHSPVIMPSLQQRPPHLYFCIEVMCVLFSSLDLPVHPNHRRKLSADQTERERERERERVSESDTYRSTILHLTSSFRVLSDLHVNELSISCDWKQALGAFFFATRKPHQWRIKTFVGSDLLGRKNWSLRLWLPRVSGPNFSWCVALRICTGCLVTICHLWDFRQTGIFGGWTSERWAQNACVPDGGDSPLSGLTFAL